MSGVKFIKAELIFNKQGDEEAKSNSYRKAEDIDKGINFLPFNVSDGN
ncbi:hypothetical protein A33Q_4552 [Indibacter alkaliphilus LW1]|uniref:Uncharacterized protein n=1 Tax=Indibacter alkaliphilus (strain CCUG 57479 / KCTC 22604 / LW1) TaxID=1189612 RepID=S2CY13_INDAL|nr:hypothetical protein A33Q_4552 [Indibacter alkaliphilus LW1]